MHQPAIQKQTSSPPRSTGTVDCQSWSASDKPGIGHCARQLYGGRPTWGLCLYRCPRRVNHLGKPAAPLPATQQRPAPALRQALTLAMALSTAKRVSSETVQARMKTCQACEFRRLDKQGQAWCGVCGCSVSSDDRKIVNLAAYVENLPHWGCKHPKRKEGAGWKA
jgi:hypothetical protein